MKNLLILAVLTIFIFACKDEGAAGPQHEEVIEEIILSYGSYEAIREFDTISIIENKFFYSQGKGNSYENNNFERELDSFELNEIIRSVNISEFIELDSVVFLKNGASPGGRDDGVIELEIIFKSDSHKVICSMDSIPDVVSKISNEIFNIYDKYKKE
jgi:hypothetical protein